MNLENTHRIISACPCLFDTGNKQFYFECGDGWTDLLVELCEKMQSYLSTLEPEILNEFVALQVKEKYGELRFYLSAYDEVLENLISEYTKKSRYVCESCSKPGHIRGQNWWYAACDEHTRPEDFDTASKTELP